MAISSPPCNEREEKRWHHAPSAHSLTRSLARSPLLGIKSGSGSRYVPYLAAYVLRARSLHSALMTIYGDFVCWLPDDDHYPRSSSKSKSHSRRHRTTTTALNDCARDGRRRVEWYHTLRSDLFSVRRVHASSHSRICVAECRNGTFFKNASSTILHKFIL